MKYTLLILLFVNYCFAQKTTITTEKIEPFKKVLIVSQSEISKYRFDGITKEFSKLGYDITCKNLLRKDLSLDNEEILYKKAIEEIKPEIMIIITKQADGKHFEFGQPSILNSYDVWNYEARDTRTDKVIYKAVFHHFEPKKIIKQMMSDGLIKNVQ